MRKEHPEIRTGVHQYRKEATGSFRRSTLCDRIRHLWPLQSIAPPKRGRGIIFIRQPVLAHYSQISHSERAPTTSTTPTTNLVMMRKLHGGGGRDRKGRARAELRYADDEASGQGELHFPSSSLLLPPLGRSCRPPLEMTKKRPRAQWPVLPSGCFRCSSSSLLWDRAIRERWLSFPHYPRSKCIVRSDGEEERMLPCLTAGRLAAAAAAGVPFGEKQWVETSTSS